MTTTNLNFKNKPENVQDREQKLRKLSMYSKTALEAFTVNELREVAAWLIPKAHKLKKADFIQAILDVTEPYKAERLQQTIIAINLAGNTGLDSELFSKAFNSLTTPEQTSEALIAYIESQNLAPSTIAKTTTKQIRNLLDALTIQNPDTKEWSSKVYENFKSYAAKYHHQVNVDYANKVEEIGTAETMRKIQGEPVIKWVTETIDFALTQENLDKGWHKVSLALAIATGRRMDEIHGDKATFRVIDENTIETTGLSKKKEDDYVHVSPCLVNAYKWLEAYNKLPARTKNLSNAQVNNNVCRALSESLKKTDESPLIYLFGNDDAGFKTSYKTSRDFYVAYLITNVYNRIQHGTEINYAKSLLGHSAKRQTLSYQKIIII